MAAVWWVVCWLIRVLNLLFGFYMLQNILLLSIVVVIEDVCRWRLGLVIVVVVGNDGLIILVFLVASKYVVGVGALDGGGKGFVLFSNRGFWVDVNAPGTFVTGFYVDGVEDVRFTRDGDSDRFDGKARWSGTSFAIGLVSGTVAVALIGVALGLDVALV